MPAMSWMHKVLFGRGTDAAHARTQPPPLCDADDIRWEMIEAVRSCREAHRLAAESKLRRASSPLDLWQLRPEVYLYLAQDLGQFEANQRINALLPLFRGWVPEATVFTPH